MSEDNAREENSVGGDTHGFTDAGRADGPGRRVCQHCHANKSRVTIEGGYVVCYACANRWLSELDHLLGTVGAYYYNTALDEPAS